MQGFQTRLVEEETPTYGRDRPSLVKYKGKSTTWTWKPGEPPTLDLRNGAHYSLFDRIEHVFLHTGEFAEQRHN